MSAVAYPFLRLREGGFSPWMLDRGDGAAEPLGDHVAAWDYGVDMTLTRTFALDPIAAALELGLGGARILAVVSAATGGGRGERARRVVWQEEAPANLQPLLVEFTLAGAELSETLTLITELVLLEAQSPSALSPTAAMTRLWRETITTQLDPETRRFPIETTSFEALLRDRPSTGAWYLDWSVADVDREFTSAVRLYLNADQPQFVARVSAADEPLVQLLMGSVKLQLVRGLLDTDGFSLQLASEQPETLGGVVAGWISEAFPNQSLETVRALASGSPGVFEASLAAGVAEAGDD